MAGAALRTAKANAAQNFLREEDIKAAKAAVDQAKAGVALAEQQFSYTYVKSPIAGTLSSRLTEPGQVVSPGQPLAEVVNLGSLYLKGDVSETELANAAKGQRVRVHIDALAPREFQGTVRELFPAGSTQSRNFPVRIGIEDESRLIRPGMFARGSIVTGVDRNVLLIPKDAVEERRGTKMVFVVGPRHKVKRHDIEVKQENRDFVELKAPVGLKVGDVVVTRGRQNLQDESLVNDSSRGR
jgi:RND family efflux transporter MFP subunit